MTSQQVPYVGVDSLSSHVCQRALHAVFALNPRRRRVVITLQSVGAARKPAKGGRVGCTTGTRSGQTAEEGRQLTQSQSWSRRRRLKLYVYVRRTTWALCRPSPITAIQAVWRHDRWHHDDVMLDCLPLDLQMKAARCRRERGRENELELGVEWGLRFKLPASDKWRLTLQPVHMAATIKQRNCIENSDLTQVNCLLLCSLLQLLFTQLHSS